MKSRKSITIILLMLVLAVVTAIPVYATVRRPGDFLGNVLNTDIRVFIDGRQIMGYNIDGWTYVVAEDLRAFGFTVTWNATARSLSITRGRAIGTPRPVPLNRAPIGSIAFPYVYTDIVTYIEGRRVPSFNIQGYTVVQIDDLADAFGRLEWDGANRVVRVFTETTPTTHTVTFSNQGITHSTRNVTHGNAIGTLPTPTRAGYNFGGWFTGVSGTGIQVVTSTQVTQNITLLAHWIPVPVTNHTVTFSSQGTTHSTRSVVHGNAIGTLPTPTRFGYTFGGWFSGTGGAGERATATVPVTHNITLFAHWIPVTNHTVTFSSQGATHSTRSVAHNTAIGALPTPTRVGYTFGGWFTGVNGTGIEVVATSQVTQNITLFAHWIPVVINHTVTFSDQGITHSTRSVANNTAIGALPTLTRFGYTLGGWFTGVNGTGIEVVATSQVTQNITLFAHWIPVPVTNHVVTFSCTYTGDTSRSVADGNTLGAPPAPTRTGFTLGGWFTGTGGTGIGVVAETVITQSITLFPHWIAD